MSELLREIEAKLTPIFARYGVERAFVFGSVARGEQTRRSDIDLIVIQDVDQEPWGQMSALERLISSIFRLVIQIACPESHRVKPTAPPILNGRSDAPTPF